MDESKLDGGCLVSEHDRQPHEAISFVLAYLPLFELLAMAQVCKSLRDAVRNDILPWLKLVVDRSLSYRLTDDILMELASKGMGRIQVLALINCLKITDDGLLRIVSSNPSISQMHLPGCTSLTTEAIIEAAKRVRLNSLSISGIRFTNQEHLRTLQQLMEAGREQGESKILYHEYMKLSPLERINADHQIDVDICPKCNEVKMVFDCPQLSCGKKCRGCSFCITRCIECGVCLSKDDEIEELCCEDAMCSECWIKQQPKCSLCNKPYCSKHSDQQIHNHSGSSGFICASCHFNFTCT